MPQDDHPFAAPTLSIVVPVYHGGDSLNSLIEALRHFAAEVALSHPTFPRVVETILVFDGISDEARRSVENLGMAEDWITTIWLSRNFGQHAATSAGISSSSGDWIATLDEDGAHSPEELVRLYDQAINDGADIVYATPRPGTSHKKSRQMLSSIAKNFAAFLSGDKNVRNFQSFRLVRGAIARSALAMISRGTNIDVALSWVSSRASTVVVSYRGQSARTTAYSIGSLLSHFWNLILSSGIQALRAFTFVGIGLFLAGQILGLWLFVQWLQGEPFPQGWLTLVLIQLFFSGVTLLGIGLMSEFVAKVLDFSSGRPPYVVVNEKPTPGKW